MKLLGILFQPHEAEALSGLAHALGLEAYDAVQLGGNHVEKGPHHLWVVDHVSSVDALAPAILPLCQGYSHIAAVSSMASKDLIPRLAEALSSGMVSDVVGVISASEFKRPMLAGSVLATVSVINSGSPICLTVRAASFKHVELFQTESVEPLAVEIGKVKVVSASKASATRPDLSQAKVVVSGGKPLKDAVTFERLMGGLADALDGAVGATRAAVDSGIAPNELQVGQTGKVVAPDLYIAAGISGSTQHVAGIKDSKLIVAINKDPDAPIFDVADLGLVADLFEAVPELTAKLSS